MHPSHVSLNCPHQIRVLTLNKWLPMLRVLRKAQDTWLWQHILMPFTVTRATLSLIGWFSRYFPINLDYPIQAAVLRGWHFSPHRLLDIWARWDSGWYLTIATRGYSIPHDITTSYSTIAFFPLYPYLIRILAVVIPRSLATTGVFVLIGWLVSNLMLIGALIFVRQLVIDTEHDDRLAERAVWYLLLFPTSFFFSCVYTESTFLFLASGALLAALREKWPLAGIASALLVLSRPQGILIVLPLLWAFAAENHWTLKGLLRPQIGWILLAPVALLGHLVTLYPLTGNLLAPLLAQHAWNHQFALPWQSLLHPQPVTPYLTSLMQALALISLVAGLASLKVLKSKTLAVFTLTLLLFPLFTTNVGSVIRHYATVFPILIVLAIWGRNATVNAFIQMPMFALQALLMGAWCQFYWIA